MKKQVLAIIIAGSLSACSADQEKPVQEGFSESFPLSIEEPTEEELAEQFREEAELAIFSELNVDNPPAGKKVTAAGKVVTVFEAGIMGTFALQTNEGVYTIRNLTKMEAAKGSTMTIYGVVAVDKAADGTPVINAVVIE